ncbi:hypothetical protein C5167_013822 [Papaver somniferum]|uniref:Uncharacterized protein n=1 Tax=Papaver somniferum TaxID=3469 RepID=A0A4Y7J1G7_PAPSO|nr:hypothetical protein C5167_013822 [Papaver somniferum]
MVSLIQEDFMLLKITQRNLVIMQATQVDDPPILENEIIITSNVLDSTSEASSSLSSFEDGEIKEVSYSSIIHNSSMPMLPS